MRISRRRLLRAGSGAAILAAVGCDQLPDALILNFSGDAADRGPFDPPSAESIDPIVHAINRLSFGARPGDFERVKSLGDSVEAAFDAYVAEQLAPEKIDDRACDRVVRRLESLNQPLGELFEYQERLLLGEMVRGAILRSVLSKRQLFEVMVQFWTDHFNIDPSKGDCKWLKAADDRTVIRKHALGSFPELLHASAVSPAMLWYLDGRENRKLQDDDKPNENYARELLELHTLGVHGGYSQRDVMEVARCLTGWTVRSGEWLQKGKVEFKPRRHDDGPKEVLGQRIEAGLGAGDLDRVLEIVSLHPSTARYIATKLCRRFIADEPPEGAVTTVSNSFLESRGDIRATLRSLFATPEFRQSRGTKFKRPFHYIVSALRATGARTAEDANLLDYLLRMGHAPFHYPTPDGYPEDATPWLGTLLWRWNFAVALSENEIHGVRIDAAELRQKLGGDNGLMGHILGRKPTAQETEGYHASGTGLALMLASPGFQRC